MIVQLAVTEDAMSAYADFRLDVRPDEIGFRDVAIQLATSFSSVATRAASGASRLGTSA
jgi:hypothetical protein